MKPIKSAPTVRLSMGDKSIILRYCSIPLSYANLFSGAENTKPTADYRTVSGFFFDFFSRESVGIKNPSGEYSGITVGMFSAPDPKSISEKYGFKKIESNQQKGSKMSTDNLLERLYELEDVNIFLPVAGVDTKNTHYCFCSKCLKSRTIKGSNWGRKKSLKCSVCGTQTPHYIDGGQSEKDFREKLEHIRIADEKARQIKQAFIDTIGSLGWKFVPLPDANSTCGAQINHHRKVVYINQQLGLYTTIWILREVYQLINPLLSFYWQKEYSKSFVEAMDIPDDVQVIDLRNNIKRYAIKTKPQLSKGQI